MPEPIVIANSQQQSPSGSSPAVTPQTGLEREITQTSAPAMVTRSKAAFRGMPEDVRAPLNSVQSCCDFARSHVREFTLLYNAAKVDLNSDRGLEIQQLAKLFEPGGALEKHPQLLERLCALAQTDSLFGRSPQSLGDEAFYEMRREFLVDVIRGAIDSDAIIQGREPMCTAASALKLLEPAEYVRLATDLALSTDGHAITASGAVMKVHPEFFRRAQVSAARLNGDIFCAQPSAGSLMMLYGVIQLGDTQANPSVPLIERQEGAFWYEYTMAVQKLTGERYGCAGANAVDIGYDRAQGHAVRGLTTEVSQTVATFDYLKSELHRGRPVFIHTTFNAANSQGAVGRAHSEHAMVAEAIVASGTNGLPNDGHNYVRVSNPIGDFFKLGRDSAGRPIEFSPGDVLGDRNGFWFVAGDKGDIFVREDVLKSNLYSALVRYNDKYTFQQGDEPQSYGTLDTGGIPHRFIWVDQPAELADKKEEGDAPDAVQAVAVSQVAVDNAADTRESDKDRDNEPRRVAAYTDRRRSREEDELLSVQLAAAKNADKQGRDSEKTPSVASFGNLGATSRALAYGVNGGREATMVPADTFNNKVSQAVSQQPPREATAAPAQEGPTRASSTSLQPGESPRLKALFSTSA